MPSSRKAVMPLVTAISLQPGSASLTVLQLWSAWAGTALSASQLAPASSIAGRLFIALPLCPVVLIVAVGLAGLWKARLAFEVVEVDVVAHVLLAGVDQRLVIPALERAQGQGLGDETPSALAGEYLLIKGRQGPFGPCLGQECGEQRLVPGALAEFMDLVWILAGVE